MPEMTIRGADSSGHFHHGARSLAVLGLALLVTAGSLAVAAPAHAAALTAVIDDVTYAFDDADVAAGATVTDFTQAGRTSLSIPASITVDGASYPVTAIGDFALDGNADGTGLSSLTLPDSITSIGVAAIAGNELTTIDLPDALTSIGDTAFANNLLESLVVPDSVTTIDGYAFYQNAIATLELGTGVTSIGWLAFATNRLTSLTIPDSVTSIGMSAFLFNQLRDVTLGSAVGIVGDAAFSLNFDYGWVRNTDPDWDGFTADSATLESVAFTGPAPAVADPADSLNFTGAGSGLGAYPDRDIYGSLGPAYGVTIYYPLAYGAPQTAGGFTTSPWFGYPTQGIADVSFEMNGHGDPVRTQPINVGSTATEPPAPTATGWTFTGWFTDAGLATAFDFATPITAATVIHAGWTENVAPPAPTTTVSFALNGHGTAIPNQTVKIGSIATKPSDPTATGWTFTGWFTDAGLATAFDFATPITAATVIHAGWTENVVIPPTEKPTPPVTQPPVTVPPAAQPTGAAPLAKTGTTDPRGTVFAAFALALGGGMLLVRRRKQH